MMQFVMNVTDGRKFNQYCLNLAQTPKIRNERTLSLGQNPIMQSIHSGDLVCIGLPIAVHSLNDISWRPLTPK